MKVDTGVAKKAVRMAVLAGVFVVSFLLFLVMTFPYEVLKESIAANLSRATGFNISIGDMGASLPLGMKAEKVRIEGNTPGVALELSGLRVNVSVLSFFVGQLGVDVEATVGKGVLTVKTGLGLFDLAGGVAMPKRLALDAKFFPLDNIITFALNNAANSPTASPMVAPILPKILVSAQLNGDVDLALDSKNLAQSTGALDLQLTNAVLDLSDQTFGLGPNRKEKFKKAQFKAKIEGGVLALDKASGFVADDLELTPAGKITLKQPPMNSQLDLKIMFKLTNELKSSFGIFLGGGSAGAEGELTTLVRGTLDQPQTSNL